MSRLITVLIGLSLITSVTWSQGNRGNITGTITDSAGASVSGASVKVRNDASGLEQSTTTAEDGRYNLPYLPSGRYVLTVEKAGFKTVQQSDVEVEISNTTRVDQMLQVGAVQQTIDVTAAVPLVVTERSDLGTTMTTKEITDLPLALGGGLRDNLNFTLLTPGTVLDRGNDNSLRIGGGLSAGQSMLLDGAETISERRNDAGFQAVSTDAIEEFRVISNAFSAEFGRSGNGIISFNTKSGTNQFHATGFEYFRNDKLNARQFFSPLRSVVRENDFGATAGGPVWIPKIYNGRDKAFFFFSFEKDITRNGNPSGTSTVPTSAFRNGDFSQYTNASGAQIPIYDPATTQVVNGQVVRQQFPNNQIPSNRISPISQTVLKYIPDASRPGIANNINTVGNSGADQYVWSVKGDYNITPNSRLSGLFSKQFFSSPDSIGPISGPLGNNFNSAGKNKFYRVSHDQVITPTLLNHVTFGWNNRDVYEYFPQRYDSIPASDRAIIALKGAVATSPTSNIVPPPAYNIGGVYGEYGFWINTLSPSRTANLNEQLTWSKGPHNIKFGFMFLRADYRRLDCNGCTGEADFSNNTTGLPGAAGATGNNFASFLLGLPSSGSYNTPGDFSFGVPYYAWYVQDDWKISRKLTVNVGLRYELPFPKTESQSRVSNLCWTCPNPAAGNIPGALQFAGQGPGRTGQTSFYDTRLNAWGPRLGFAYEVLPNLVIRAGGGLFYIPQREGGNADRAELGFRANVNVTSPDSGYTPAFTLANGLPAAPPLPNLDPGQNLFGTVPFAARYAGYAGKMGNWNFTVEKGLGRNTVVRASYQGSAGISLLSNRELLNQVDPRYLSLGSQLLSPISAVPSIRKPWATFPDSRSVGQALRPFPQYTGFDHDVDADTTGHSTYHAGSISVQQRYSAGLWLTASYTFSKLISNVQGENPALGTFIANGDGSTQNAYDRRADKAISNQDIPHHVVLAYSYELPVGKGKRFLANANGFTQSVLGGWKISAIHNYQSGYPLRVNSNLTLGIFSGGERANYVGGPMKNPAFTGDPNTAPYINLSAFQRPAPFTFGNSGLNLPWLRSPATLEEDVTLGKDFPLFKEGQRLEFKASAFNIGNRVRFGGINTTVEDQNFGKLTSQQNRAREVQLSLRAVF